MAPSIALITPTSGHSGQTMTITGSGLGTLTTTKVNIGTKTVTPTTASSGIVTAAIPSGCTGQANVSVTVSGVNSNSTAFFFVAAPTVTSLTPSIGPAAPVGAIDIFGSGFSTATTVAFGAVGTVGATIVSDSHCTATPPAHGAFTACTDAADVLVTNVGGTSSATGPAGQFTYYELSTVLGVTPSPTPVGTTGVIVTGTCFVDVSDVTLTPTGGGAPTSALNVSATGPGSLTFDVPGTLTAGTYDTQVITPGGPSLIVPADVITLT